MRRGGADEDSSCFGRAYAARMAFKEPELQDVFELLKALRQRWLTDTQDGGCIQKAALPLDASAARSRFSRSF